MDAKKETTEAKQNLEKTKEEERNQVKQPKQKPLTGKRPKLGHGGGEKEEEKGEKGGGERGGNRKVSDTKDSIHKFQAEPGTFGV